MDAGTQEQERARADEPVVVPDTPAASPAGEVFESGGAAAVEAYARDHEGLTEENERDALDWLLGANPPTEYVVPVDFDTPQGTRKLKWTVRSLDGRKINAIEDRNRNESSGILDQITADCQLVADATVRLEGRDGHVIDIHSEEFRTMKVRMRQTGEVEDFTHASAAEAIEARFRKQVGLVLGVAREVRRISGFDPAKVGQAQRRLVEASGN